MITTEAKAWQVDLACRKAKELGYPHVDDAAGRFALCLQCSLGKARYESVSATLVVIHSASLLSFIRSSSAGTAAAFASAACRPFCAWIALSISATSGEQHLFAALCHEFTSGLLLAENAVGLARRGQHDTKKPKPVEVSAGSCPPKR
jgi:hypothetical protein